MSYKRNIQKKAKFQGEFDIEGVKQILGKKVATEVKFEEMREKLPLKTAIILLGISGCGKTTFAKQYVTENPGIEVVGMDDCYQEAAIQVGLPLFNPEKVDDEMLDIFDQKLRKYSMQRKSILLDGFWGDMRTRGALIDTLREYGYKICIMYFAISQDKIVEYATKRSIKFAATNILKKSQIQSISGAIDICENPIKILAEQCNASEEEVIKRVANSRACADEAMRLCKSIQREINLLNPQVASGVITFGADYIAFYDIS